MTKETPTPKRRGLGKANGGWTSRGQLFPRTGMSVLGWEAIHSDLARLVVTGKVSLQFVGSLTLARKLMSSVWRPAG